MSGSVVGSVNFGCELEFTTDAMIQWTEELARLIQGQLPKSLGSAERTLLRAYLSRPHGRRDPVMYVNEQTFIASAAASRLTPPLDRVFIAHLARSLRNGPHTGTVDIPLRDHSCSVRATWETVDGGGTGVVGLALRLTPFADHPRDTTPPARHPAVSSPAPAAGAADDAGARDALSDLAGSGPAWQGVRAAVRVRSRGTPLLVAGEPGTGKSAIVDRLKEPGRMSIDAREHEGRMSTWLSFVADAFQAGQRCVTLENLDVLPEAAVMSVCDLVLAAQRETDVLATWSLAADHELTANAGTYGPASWPGTVVRVPPVRERLEDLPELLNAFTRRRTATRQLPAWAPETVTVLHRVQWRQNLHSLERVVAEVLRRRQGPVIRPDCLPSAVLQSATRRRLSGLERLETDALAAALASAGGNRRVAAEVLGISRSSLYRKLKAAGLAAMDDH